MNLAEKRVIAAAKDFCNSANGLQSLDDMPSAKVHELYGSVRDLDARKRQLIRDIRSLVAGVELTGDEGDALIEEIRIRIRIAP